MKLPFWQRLFGRGKRRQARYVLVFRTELCHGRHEGPGEMATPHVIPPSLAECVQRFTPVISAGQFNKLPTRLQQHFTKVGK